LVSEIQDQLLLAKTLSNYGNLILATDPSEKAEVIRKNSVDVASQINAKDVIARSNWGQGLYYEMKGWNLEAIEFLRNAVNGFKDLKMAEYTQASKHLMEFMKKHRLI